MGVWLCPYGGTTMRRELGRGPVRRSAMAVRRQGPEASGCGQADGHVGASLGRVPARIGESGANGWAPLQSQVAWATDIYALATVPGFEFPKPVNFIQI
jgi:hypothetical protein